MPAVARVLGLLAEHAGLIEEIVQAIESGLSGDDIRAAIRAAKVKVSDDANAEEMRQP